MRKKNIGVASLSLFALPSIEEPLFLFLCADYAFFFPMNYQFRVWKTGTVFSKPASAEKHAAGLPVTGKKLKPLLHRGVIGSQGMRQRWPWKENKQRREGAELVMGWWSYPKRAFKVKNAVQFLSSQFQNRLLCSLHCPRFLCFSHPAKILN